jgi:maltooligosyltrehalose synthase
MWVTMRGLQLRNSNPELFHRGSYVPLESANSSRHVCAFARSQTGITAQHSETVIVAVPRFSYTLAGGKPIPPMGDIWKNEAIRLPEGSLREFENIFTGERVSAADNTLLCRELFRSFPVAVLVGR